MTERIPRATHWGEIKIGNIVIPCAVLEDGTRLLTQEGFLRAMGRAKKAKGGHGASVARVPAFMAANNLIPFIPNDIAGSTTPVQFRGVRGNIGFGYKAALLPSVCQIYLEARDANKLFPNQEHIAQKAEIIIRGLAHIGIIALVDEATGYQEVRDRLALQKILDKFLLQEYAKWAKRFPDEFYEQMFRLKGWQWKGMKINRPSIVGKYTNDLVYERLAPGLLDELRRLNPPGESGRRKVKHQQWLTEDIGHPELQKHLAMLIGFERASANWGMFYRMVQRALPKYGETIPLALEET